VPLSPRQVIFYQDRADIWMLTQTSDPGSGLFQTKTYALSAADVPCYFRIRQSIDEPTALGRIEGDNIFTRDEIYFADDTIVDSDAIIVNKSIDANGVPSVNYGRFWVVAGQPRSNHRRGIRRGEKRVTHAVQMQVPPVGVTV
jgi:hypothetical protein